MGKLYRLCQHPKSMSNTFVIITNPWEGQLVSQWGSCLKPFSGFVYLDSELRGKVARIGRKEK
jgi:hypothetical protein